MKLRHRGLTHLVGAREHTADQARAMVRGLAPEAVLWLDGPSQGSALRQALGRSFDAVVLDQHSGADADAIAAAVGFVRGGGRLVLRWSEVPPPSPRLRLPPWPDSAISRHLERRLRAPSPVDLPAEPLRAADRPTAGSPDQDQAIEALLASLSGPSPSLVALVARRGRGKSTALGLALAQRPPHLRYALTAPSRQAAHEVLAHAPELPFLDPLEALDADLDVLAIDEAAQLSVPLLRQLVRRHPTATLWFATTTGGYEGTGQGFVHRFLATLDADPRSVTRPRLEAPIRWAADDPLERWASERLLLAPRVLPAPSASGKLATPDLSTDEPALREVFALLTQAHYRTTPSDLQRLLDAPNLTVTTLVDDDGRVAGVNLLADEGGLPAELCDAMATGATRIRGHALADTLATLPGLRVAMVDTLADVDEAADL